MSSLSRFFSNNYREARDRFLAAAQMIGANVYSYPISARDVDNLVLDVAVMGNDQRPTVVVSSGVHGVEGFFGSAVQLALLEDFQRMGAHNIRYVLLHAVNPFGFDQLRRFNEDNVDLNRNFLGRAQQYQGAPPKYAELHGLLNPTSPPTRIDLFHLKALRQILRHGLEPLKEAVAGGQYEFPRGLFFGGKSASRSMQLIKDHARDWIGESRQVMHIDLHTGLGAHGSCKLLLVENRNSANFRWYCKTFGERAIEPFDEPVGTAYRASGLFGSWMQRYFRDRDYRFAMAEFGTYGVIRVLSALRAENQSYHYGSDDSASTRRAKQVLLECFCPRSLEWRYRVVDTALTIIERAVMYLGSSRDAT